MFILTIYPCNKPTTITTTQLQLQPKMGNSEHKFHTSKIEKLSFVFT